jgi:hypothetical protein
LWKDATAQDGNPPPQPSLYSYLMPVDCLSTRFLMTTLPATTTGVPLMTNANAILMPMSLTTDSDYVPATDIDANGNPIKVILTNVPQAQLVYTRDLSQTPDSWDALFLSAASAYLGTYFINALARNRAQLQDQIAMTKNILDEARSENGNEGITAIDMSVDWMVARGVTGPWPWNARGTTQYQPLSFPGGASY